MIGLVVIGLVVKCLVGISLVVKCLVVIGLVVISLVVKERFGGFTKPWENLTE